MTTKANRARQPATKQGAWRMAALIIVGFWALVALAVAVGCTP